MNVPRRLQISLLGSLGLMSGARFDLSALFRSLDAERQRLGLNWSVRARQLGVSASTLRRFGAADDAEADGVPAAVRWLGVAPEAYVVGMSGEGVLLPAGGDGFVRVDMALVAEAMGERDARGRTRTTIQSLVAAARRSQQPIATLSRLSNS